ncbi:hypothetical protein [Pseudomonas entomophila]|uniref:Secretion system X translation initiation factor n=2 Tax=Pseudomonas entomophila TaxID=312306 RepID=Q1I9Q2_PSEE4|nr:hypothetical protein [Pseudomonas entomophila]WMW03634.1 hypothetical protein RAH46_14905 [Pseudomonas entomophila]CAK15622.1 conserved hypothetical protein; putative signal peptide [Pseudomonas entomophila L48]
MNIQRVVLWGGFLGVSALLAWAPGHWFDLEGEVAPFAGKPAPTGSAQPLVGAGLPANKPQPPSKDLFPAQQWAPPQTLATVTEQPVVTAPVVAAPTAPALPFQFVGRLGDRDDLQVFLQNGEKLYVVRQGDVIEDTYRLDRVSASELSLVYLPLHQPQTLSVGSAP